MEWRVSAAAPFAPFFAELRSGCTDDADHGIIMNKESSYEMGLENDSGALHSAFSPCYSWWGRVIVSAATSAWAVTAADSGGRPLLRTDSSSRMEPHRCLVRRNEPSALHPLQPGRGAGLRGRGRPRYHPGGLPHRPSHHKLRPQSGPQQFCWRHRREYSDGLTPCCCLTTGRCNCCRRR